MSVLVTNPKLMAWNNFQSLRGRLYDILFQGHISINLSPWLAFEIALTAAFLSTEGRGGWGNWAIGINVHNEVLDGNIHFMLTSTRRVSTLLKVLHNYQSYDLGHHFWGLKCRAGLARLNFCYI